MDYLHMQHLMLTDLSGRTIKEFSPEDKELDIAGLSAGIYFLLVTAKEGTLTKKIILQ